ncbi:MAG: hypothetical protein IPM42_07395 [Saprospiraceae bacterium]|nr:hypothetical protein [Saprospiraceae bacterium]
MQHSHTIPIRKIFKNDISNESIVPDQFYKSFLEKGSIKHFIKTLNLPDIDFWVADYKMVVIDETIGQHDPERYSQLDFVFPIPTDDPERVTINEDKREATFKMRTVDKNDFVILHPPKVTCSQRQKPILNDDNSRLFHYSDVSKYDSNDRIFVPMIGFYDGNTNKFDVGIKKDDFFGFYYSPDIEEFNNLQARLANAPSTLFDCDFTDDLKLYSPGGFWYHEELSWPI